MKRNATVIWKGSGREGAGTISTQSGSLSEAYYAWDTRFENEPGTNPEELLGAAHAACFTMKLSALLKTAGFPAERIETTAEVTLEKEAISHSHLVVKALVPNIGSKQFVDLAEDAKTNCPVSKALNMKISMEAVLLENTPVRPMD